MLIFVSDIKGSLYRSEVEDAIGQLCSKMGSVITEDSCKAKLPKLDEHYLNDDTNGDLEIGDNRPEEFDV